MIRFEDHRDVIENQGWNEDTMLFLAETFIHECGLDQRFGQYLKDKADEENSEV